MKFMTRSSLSILLSFSILFFAACSNGRQADVSPSTINPIPAIITATKTPSPTAEYQITPTITFTPGPTATDTALPIERAKTTSISPDGKWTAYFFDYSTAEIIVENSEKMIRWEINEGNFDGFEALFVPCQWSHDSKYLYFNTRAIIDGYVPFYDGMGLRRLDVFTGKVSEILPTYDATDNAWNIVNFALSTNEKKLAFVDSMDGEPRLVIRDLESGSEKNLLLKGYTDAGSLLWSPDDQQLALALSKGDDWENTLFSIATIDIATLKQKLLIRDDKKALDPLKWVDTSQFLIQERGGNTRLINLVTREVRIVATVTPFPK